MLSFILSLLVIVAIVMTRPCILIVTAMLIITSIIATILLIITLVVPSHIISANTAGYTKSGAAAQPQDFIKGWPHPELLSRADLRAALTESFKQGLELSEQSLNYGDAVNGAYMLGHPRFLQGLAKFLEGQYQTSVDPKTLMSTVGASMGTDLAFRAHGKAGDICVFEDPTYFLAFTMARNSGLELKGVPMHEDGMDLDALERVCSESGGKVKFVPD
eukprot:s5217_g1.t1